MIQTMFSTLVADDAEPVILFVEFIFFSFAGIEVINGAEEIAVSSVLLRFWLMLHSP